MQKIFEKIVPKRFCSESNLSKSITTKKKNIEIKFEKNMKCKSKICGYHLKQIGKADQHWKKALQIKPYNPGFHSRYGSFLWSLNSNNCQNDAEFHLQQALELAPNHTFNLNAWAYRRYIIQSSSTFCINVSRI